MTTEKAIKNNRIFLPFWAVTVNCHVLYLFMTELLFCFATVTVDIMVSSKAAADLNQVLLSSHLRLTITPNNWSGLYPYLCGKHMCKADPSVGHQNRRVNPQLKALTLVLLMPLLRPCVISPLRKTRLRKTRET